MELSLPKMEKSGTDFTVDFKNFVLDILNLRCLLKLPRDANWIIRHISLEFRELKVWMTLKLDWIRFHLKSNIEKRSETNPEPFNN